jgi:tetratricopeptide (TPR) repeat protein
MPTVPMIPAHEREHIDQASEYLASRIDKDSLARWNRATVCVEEARVYDAFLEYHEMLKDNHLDPICRTHVQLQAVRCLRDAPVERIKNEMAFIEPHTAYQTIVLDYRLGWLMRHRLNSAAASTQYFDRVREEARRLNARPWEIAALLQTAEGAAADGEVPEAIELFTRVYNLSRRNGLVEFIPKALTGRGLIQVRQGNRAEGDDDLQKAFELACRNKLIPEQAQALHAMANVYHREYHFFGLALEYYEQARIAYLQAPVWASLREDLEKDAHACQAELDKLDIAKILGPVPITRLRQDYLTSLVNGFVGIPGIDNRSQLGERIGLTRQAIHRNING